jgi:hypothetical protein
MARSGDGIDKLLGIRCYISACLCWREIGITW